MAHIEQARCSSHLACLLFRQRWEKSIQSMYKTNSKSHIPREKLLFEQGSFSYHWKYNLQVSNALCAKRLISIWSLLRALIYLKECILMPTIVRKSISAVAETRREVRHTLSWHIRST